MELKWEDIEHLGFKKEDFLEASGGADTVSSEALASYCKYTCRQIRKMCDSMGLNIRE